MPRTKSNTIANWGFISLIALFALLVVRKNRINFDVVDNTKYAALKPYLIAQAKHESDIFRSELYQKMNNAFGMQRPDFRDTLDLRTKTLIVEGEEMANFASPTDSVRDQLLWLEEFNFPESVDSAYQFAKEMKDRGYYTDSIENYWPAIERHLPA